MFYTDDDGNGIESVATDCGDGDYVVDPVVHQVTELRSIHTKILTLPRFKSRQKAEEFGIRIGKAYLNRKAC